MRALIAMSGGVDSSAAALLMQRSGYACEGVTMRLYRSGDLVLGGGRILRVLKEEEKGS